MKNALALCFLFGSLALAAEPAAVNPADLLKSGAAFEKKKDFAAACRLYLKALADNPKNLEAQEALSRAGGRLQEQHEAVEESKRHGYVRDAQRSLERGYAAQAGLRKRCDEGRELLSQGKVFEASDAFNKILEEAPGFDDARVQLAKVQRQLSLRLKRGRFPTTQYFAATEGIFHFNQGDWEQAGRSLQTALDAGPLPGDLAAGKLGEYAALSKTKLDLELWRRERKDLLAQAGWKQKEGKLKDARALLQKILDRDPGDAEARAVLENLGTMMTAVKLSTAEETKKREIPDLMTKGTLLMVQEKYTDALVQFNKVLDLDPANAEARESVKEVQRLMKGRKLYVPPVTLQGKAEDKYHEGLKLYGNENYEAAKTAFEDALKLDPKHEDARQALERVKEAMKP